MRSARRRLLKERKEKTKKLGKLIVPILAVLAVFLAFFLFKNSNRYWNGKDKIAVSIKRTSGDISVIVFDPRLTEATALTIPGDTEVEVAENLGSLRLKNVWQLGIDQKAGGRLLSETVTKNFLFPNFLWSDERGEALISPNLKNLVKFVFWGGATNIGVSDRISLAIFSLKVKNVDRSEIDLGKAQFLTKGRLTDGISGYSITGNISERLTVYFADYGFTDQVVHVFIKDETGDFTLADKFGQIMEVLGGKVVSIDKLPMADSDCTVTGGSADLVKKVGLFFSCKQVRGGNLNDLEIRLGAKFAKRF